MMATGTITRTASGLYPYQKRGVAEVEKLLPEPTLLVAPTGAGKTIIAAAIARRYRTVLVVAHRSELIAQSHKVMGSHVLSMSILSALNYGPSNIQLLIIDEAHRADAATYRRLIEKYAGVTRLGLTATPWRMDGKGLNDAFSHLVSVSNVKDLVAAGYLVPYVAFEAPDEALSQLPQLRKVGGDYDSKQLSSLVNTPRLVGNVVEEYKRHALGRPAVAFAVGITHSLSMASAFNAAGIRAVHVDGRASAEARAGALKQLAAREIDVVCNVNLFTEGWDCKEVRCVIMARPTASLTLYLQCAGRGMRPDEEGGKQDLVILDHAGNMARHGYPDEEREWSLEGREQRDKREAEIAALKRIAALGFESLDQYQLARRQARESAYTAAQCDAMFGKDRKCDLFKKHGIKPLPFGGSKNVGYPKAQVDLLLETHGVHDKYTTKECLDLVAEYRDRELRSWALFTPLVGGHKSARGKSRSLVTFLESKGITAAVHGFFRKTEIDALIERLKSQPASYYTRTEAGALLGIRSGSVGTFFTKRGVFPLSYNQYPKDQVDEYVRRLTEGYSLAECRSLLKLDIPDSSIHAFLRRRGIKRWGFDGNYRHDKKQVDAIVAAQETTYSIAEILSTFNFASTSGIAYKLNKLGIEPAPWVGRSIRYWRADVDRVVEMLREQAADPKCKNGHSMTDEKNVYVHPKGTRICRKCQHEKRREKLRK
jgi:DNA repair protein RadD